MKKYFVFRHDQRVQPTHPQHQQHPLESPEATACEITRVALSEYLPMGFYTACEADSPQATFEGLKTPAICTVELDDARVDLWHNEVMPIVEGMSSLTDAIDQGRNMVSESLVDLIAAAENCEAFADHDFGENIDVDSGFSYIEAPSLGDFCQRVCELFDVKYLAHAEQD